MSALLFEKSRNRAEIVFFEELTLQFEIHFSSSKNFEANNLVTLLLD